MDSVTVDRFWAKVQKTDNCWNWTAYKDPRGYSLFWSGEKLVRAHRFSYELHFGSIPDGLNVNHKCDNTSCVRPDHLYPGTQQSNLLDTVVQGNGPKQKLSTDDVVEIRNLYDTGDYTQKQLGKTFGVARETIRNVVLRRTFCHVD